MRDGAYRCGRRRRFCGRPAHGHFCGSCGRRRIDDNVHEKGQSQENRRHYHGAGHDIRRAFGHDKFHVNLLAIGQNQRVPCKDFKPRIAVIIRYFVHGAYPVVVGGQRYRHHDGCIRPRASPLRSGIIYHSRQQHRHLHNVAYRRNRHEYGRKARGCYQRILQNGRRYHFRHTQHLGAIRKNVFDIQSARVASCNVPPFLQRGGNRDILPVYEPDGESERENYARKEKTRG